MHSRSVSSLALGIVGACLGVAGLATGVSMLVMIAAICAVASSVLASTIAVAPASASSTNDIQSHIEGLTSAKPANFADYSAVAGLPDETVIDTLTGLPDRRFFDVAVDGRVAAARRHLWPVSIVLLQCGFDGDASVNQEAREKSLVSFSKLMRQTLREADIACRLGEDRFGLILEDTSEEGGVWTAERLQIALAHDDSAIKRLVAGVAAYPTHGLFAKDVMVRAQAALKRASSTPVGHGLGQVEVAHTDLG